MGNGWKVIGRLAYPANPRLDLTRFQGKSVRLGYKLHVRSMTMTHGGSDNPEKSRSICPTESNLDARLSFSNVAFDLTWFYPCPSLREQVVN